MGIMLTKCEVRIILVIGDGCILHGKGVFMAFGDCYRYERQPVTLEPGAYDVYLIWIHEDVIDGRRALRFEFKVKGMPSLPSPGEFVLFDVTEHDGKGAVDEFNARVSKIKECFALYGSFGEENYMKWEMKEGRVYVSADRSGKLVVSNFFPKANLTDFDREKL